MKKRIHPIWLFVIAVSFSTVFSTGAFGQSTINVATRYSKQNKDDQSVIRRLYLLLNNCTQGKSETACLELHNYMDSLVTEYNAGKLPFLICAIQCIITYSSCPRVVYWDSTCNCYVEWCEQQLRGCLISCGFPYPYLKEIKKP